MTDDARYLLYALRGTTRTVIAEADSPAAAGVALVTCSEEEAWDGARFGLFDAQERRWLVNPFVKA